MDEETEAQRAMVTCPRVHCEQMAGNHRTVEGSRQQGEGPRLLEGGALGRLSHSCTSGKQGSMHPACLFKIYGGQEDGEIKKTPTRKKKPYEIFLHAAASSLLPPRLSWREAPTSCFPARSCGQWSGLLPLQTQPRPPSGPEENHPLPTTSAPLFSRHSSCGWVAR